MVTNLCPYSGNEKWCPQRYGEPVSRGGFPCSALADVVHKMAPAIRSGSNSYGYQYHFDIMAQSQVLGDNPIVDFEATSCPGAASSDFAQCECA